VQDGFVSGYLLTQAIPKLSVNLSLGTRLFDERLELGSRIVHYQRHENPTCRPTATACWPAAATCSGRTCRSPGETSPPSMPMRAGASTSTPASNWSAAIGNRYYVDPATRSTLPAPGRTLKLGVTARF
jgi:hemoglobin/transferrin/lactoferrin receptor protein